MVRTAPLYHTTSTNSQLRTFRNSIVTINPRGSISCSVTTTSRTTGDTIDSTLCPISKNGGVNTITKEIVSIGLLNRNPWLTDDIEAPCHYECQDATKDTSHHKTDQPDKVTIDLVNLLLQIIKPAIMVDAPFSIDLLENFESCIKFGHSSLHC